MKLIGLIIHNKTSEKAFYEAALQFLRMDPRKQKIALWRARKVVKAVRRQIRPDIENYWLAAIGNLEKMLDMADRGEVIRWVEEKIERAGKSEG